MLSRFEELTFRNKIILAMTVGVVLFLIPILLFTFILRRTNVTNTPAPPIKFEYCKAEPDALCILSFGRDGAGHAIINFHVPDKKFPDFYLLIKKDGIQSRYECTRNTQIKTSVYCSGAPLSLKQTIQVDIHANDDDALLATGTFLLEAFLVSTPFASGTSTDTAAVTISEEPSATLETIETTETTPSEVSETSAPNFTSYPNSTSYPYP